jgi:hypothetical protein
MHDREIAARVGEGLTGVKGWSWYVHGGFQLAAGKPDLRSLEMPVDHKRDRVCSWQAWGPADPDLTPEEARKTFQIEAGYSIDEFLEQFPSVHREQVIAGVPQHL